MKSKRRLHISPPDPVFFIDRNLGADFLPNQLQFAGFRVIVHDDHFLKRQDVGDPEVIAACGTHGWFLLTGDSDLPRRWSKELKASSLGVFCQTNNHHGPILWVPRIISLKDKIIKCCHLRKRPFVAYITAETKSKLLFKL